MMDSVAIINSLKLASDQKNSITGSYISKLLNNVKTRAVPFISTSSNFFISKYSYNMSSLSNLVEMPTIVSAAGSQGIPKESKNMPFSQRFTSKTPFQIPTNTISRIPHKIGGFIGIKSYCGKKENQLDSVLLNLLNQFKSAEKLQDSTTNNRIAMEVEKYFSCKEDDSVKSISEVSQKKIMEEKNISSCIPQRIIVPPLGFMSSKPICTVQPIVKSSCTALQGNSPSDVICHDQTGNEKTDVTLPKITKSKQPFASKPDCVRETISVAITQCCTKCKAALKSNNETEYKNKKYQANNIENCSCLEDVNNYTCNGESSSNNKKTRKNKARKSKQKRKNELKLTREKQIIGLIKTDGKDLKTFSNDSGIRTSYDEVDFLKTPNIIESSCGKKKNSCRVKSTPVVTPILDDVDFDIVFDYETELCGVHSSLQLSNTKNRECNRSSLSPIVNKDENYPKDLLKSSSGKEMCENSSISFILSGNDDVCDSDSDDDWNNYSKSDNCDMSWQSFKQNFSQFQVNLNNDLGFDSLAEQEACIEVNFGDDGFEILISGGNVADEYDAFVTSSQHLREVNRKWNENMKGCQLAEDKIPKVRFAPEEQLVEIQMILFTTEDERKSPWDQYRLDRDRFQKRIKTVETVLAPILGKAHRVKIYDNRFK